MCIKMLLVLFMTTEYLELPLYQVAHLAKGRRAYTFHLVKLQILLRKIGP